VPEIRITCDVKDHLPLDAFDEFQGELKSLTKERFAKLKKRITDDGFAAPIFVWKSPEGNKILDGHQRIRTVKTMKADGWKVPDLPVVYIEAKNENHARKMLLGYVSIIGTTEKQGLYEFMDGADISFEELKADFEIPEVDMDSFGAEFFHEFPKEAYGKEVDESSADDVKFVTCPKCGEKFPA
jgi:hypothetical protein